MLMKVFYVSLRRYLHNSMYTFVYSSSQSALLLMTLMTLKVHFSYMALLGCF